MQPDTRQAIGRAGTLTVGEVLAAQARRTPARIALGDDYEARPRAAPETEPARVAEPEDGLLILHTSGTTGLPKGALISHRAELARMDLRRIDIGLAEGDAFVALAPMFHMVSLEHALHVLGTGGTVHVVDGADVPHIVRLVRDVRQWWLVPIPGMIEPLLEAPYWNSSGSTETGMAPAAGTHFGVGEAPASLAKAHNSLYPWRLVDAEDRDVAPGEPGEIAVRGPTVFSGYWNADAVNAHEFRGGWFHMGDLFVEEPDGRLRFVDRAKYLIESGGENIYPIEIEPVLMADARVAEALVVRRRDAVWGEVPVAFGALHVPGEVGADALMSTGRAGLSSYKLPREIRFVASQDDFPRSTSGKVQRQLVERWLEPGAA